MGVNIKDGTADYGEETTLNLGDGLTTTYTSGEVLTTVDDSWLKKAEITLTSANIKGMFGNPVELVAGVGGKVIVLDDVVIRFTPNATQYTGGGNIMVGTADKDLITAIDKALILSAADGTPLASWAKGVNVGSTEAEGLPLLISNADGAFATGTADATVTVRYHLV